MDLTCAHLCIFLPLSPSIMTTLAWFRISLGLCSYFIHVVQAEQSGDRDVVRREENNQLSAPVKTNTQSHQRKSA